MEKNKNERIYQDVMCEKTLSIIGKHIINDAINENQPDYSFLNDSHRVHNPE